MHWVVAFMRVPHSDSKHERNACIEYVLFNEIEHAFLLLILASKKLQSLYSAYSTNNGSAVTGKKNENHL